MELTKYTHSCVALADGDRKLVVDPGGFSETGPALAGATAVLVTHEHADHFDVDAVTAALRADSDLTIAGPASIAGALSDFADRFRAVEPGEDFEAAGFGLRTFGGQHALIHPRIPVIPNIGYLIEGKIFHPGDSFFVPEIDVDVLLAPISAPWAKLAEVIDYTIAVRAARTIPIHEAVYSEAGRGIAHAMVERFVGGFGSEYVALSPGSTTNVAS